MTMQQGAPPPNGGPVPQVPPPQAAMVGPDPHRGVEAMLNAIEQMANKTAMEDRAGEAADYAHAALYLAQAIIVLDPTLATDGTPIDVQQTHEITVQSDRHAHELALEQVKGANQIRAAKEQASAMQPAKQAGVAAKSPGG